jgi:nucleotide-binding universal stress UspA family protein
MFRILFATDGSGPAAAAGKVLEAWSLAGRAHVTVLTVVPPIPHQPRAQPPGAVRGEAERQFDRGDRSAHVRNRRSSRRLANSTSSR